MCKYVEIIQIELKTDEKDNYLFIVFKLYFRNDIITFYLWGFHKLFMSLIIYVKKLNFYF